MRKRMARQGRGDVEDRLARGGHAPASPPHDGVLCRRTTSACRCRNDDAAGHVKKKILLAAGHVKKDTYSPAVCGRGPLTLPTTPCIHAPQLDLSSLSDLLHMETSLRATARAEVERVLQKWLSPHRVLLRDKCTMVR